MFYLWLLVSAAAVYTFFRSCYPNFKGAKDLFSILGFLLIFTISSFFLV